MQSILSVYLKRGRGGYCIRYFVLSIFIMLFLEKNESKFKITQFSITSLNIILFPVNTTTQCKLKVLISGIVLSLCTSDRIQTASSY